MLIIHFNYLFYINFFMYLLPVKHLEALIDEFVDIGKVLQGKALFSFSLFEA